MPVDLDPIDVHIKKNIKAGIKKITEKTAETLLRTCVVFVKICIFKWIKVLQTKHTLRINNTCGFVTFISQIQRQYPNPQLTLS